ncbi:translocation/assembly module TamB domain-containing protein [Lutibacter sp.]|uniref:translocation/assembly module TamB domain-containing protein n=1 Tax=Lutibacter sp. TaxID=1925666 RepID=UPI002732DC73|nr:translocation/assembly module TamB domain-containing protein [Lutibacter sp.]MDP3313974.1 translocation/assembly module TamB domain-containing protein [Lutibacter sp.]
MLPPVQTRLGKKASDYLKKEFDTDLTVQKMDLSILGKVQLKEVLARDHHKDTLFYIQNLRTSILSFRNFLNGKYEFGQISLNNFELFIKTYKGENDDGLTIFIDKFDDGKVSEKPSGFLLTSTNLKLKNGFVQIIDENIANEKPLFFREIKGNANNFKIEGPNVKTNLEGIAFIENRGIDVKSLSSDFSYSKKEMNFKNTELLTETSSVNTTVKFSYKREDFSDFNNLVKLNATVKNASISFADLKKFYNEIGTRDVIHFSTNITGNLNNFVTNNLKLHTNGGSIIEGDFNFKNSFNRENGFSLNANITNLTSNYGNLIDMLPNVLGRNLPASFEKLGLFTLVGKTYVDENILRTNSVLTSEIGVAETNLELINYDNIDNASYKGYVKITDFELGNFIDNSQMGLLSVEGDVDGSGFSLEKINTAVKGIVSKFEYNKYTYKNITLNGLVKNKHFNGEVEVNDENLKLNFNGLADFSKNVYTFDFKTVVDHCNLNIINVFKRDSISFIKGDILINVKGNSLDDLVGSINFENSLYTNQKGNYFFKDFNIVSEFTDSTRTISINSSEIIEGYLKGNFKFVELGKLTQNAIGSIYSNYKPFKVSKNQFLDYSIKIHNKIIEIFYPEINLSAKTSIRGTINSDDKLFRLNIKSPRMEAFDNIITDLNLYIDSKNPLFNTQLTVRKINTKQYDISDLHLVNVTLNDTLFFRTEFKGGTNKTEDYKLSFFHTFNKDNRSVVGIQKSNFTFKNSTWTINPKNNLENSVVIDSKLKTYTVNPFLITSDSEEIEIYGKFTQSKNKDLNFKFKNVKLSSITPEIDSLKLKGLVNGILNYKEEGGKLQPTANVSIANLNINNLHQGNLKMTIEGKNSLTKYGLNISLERNGSDSFKAIGEIDFTPKKPILDVIVDFEEFKLDAFSPLGEDVFNNIRGSVYGSAHLTGLLSNPDMDGSLFLDEAGMYFPYLNVDYNFEGTSIVELKKQSFIFEDVTLKDEFYKTKGKLSGTLSHTNFSKWFLDLKVGTKRLLVLNTEEEENSLYYGTAFMEGYAFIKGPTDKLVLDFVGKTKKGTHFIIPISDVKTVESSQLIRFVNKNETRKNEDIRREFISQKLKGISLNFNIEVTKDAIVEMVLDKATGSYLKGSGTGNLQIEVDTKDKFEMFGDFYVDNGVYNFKYGGFINKPFTVRKGGSISWSGDPFGAEIDIEAVYRVSANPKSLLENITSNRKIPIDLITRFSGELFNSTREFDIDIPNSSSTVASELEFRLNNNNKNSKTIHFISLLVSGSFYNESDLSVNSNAALYGTGFDMLSNAFDNIFNQGDNKFKFKPVYTVGERNKVDNINIEDQFGFALDYQVNDRIIINGKVGVPIGSKEQSNVIGEVNIEFLLNEDGSLRSSVFNRQNEIQYTEEEEGYTQGVGLNYQIDFNNGRELLEKLGLKKKKPLDTLQVLKPIDSLKINQKLLEFKNRNKQQK